MSDLISFEVEKTKKLTLKKIDNYTFKHKDRSYTAIFENSICLDDTGAAEVLMTLVEGNNPVGYIKTFYFPKEIVEELYPDCLYWAENIKGMCLGLGSISKKLNYNEKLKIIKNGYIYLNYNKYRAFEDRIKNSETIDVCKEYEDLKKDFMKKHGKEYNIFKKETNQAFVEFSRLYNGRDKPKTSGESLKKYCESRNITLEEFKENIGTNYQGKGLAVKMYKLMADYLGLNGLVLRKGFTNEKSEPIWKYKIKNNPNFIYKKVDENELVDHSNLDLSYLY